jgi:hypothetical protein
MFIKPISIPNKKTGKRYLYFRLCESYRVGDAPRHRNILNLGRLEELPDRKDHKLLADTIERKIYKQQTLFDFLDNEKINILAEGFASIIVRKKLLDIPRQSSIQPTSQSSYELPADYQIVDLNSAHHEQVREVGTE